MAENYKVGERYYVPVMVTKVEKASEGDRYPITASFLFTKKKTAFNTFANEPDLLLTAEEVAGLLKTKADVMTVTADSLQKENEKLEAELTELEKKNLELENENGKLTAKVNNLQTDCEQYRQSNVALRRTVDALTASEDKNTHRAMLMDSLIEILLEKIEEMRR
jgi:chromosome segregation ATPase